MLEKRKKIRAVNGMLFDEWGEPISYTYEDECWCDEYEPEYDPFDSLDEPYCYY